MTISKQYRCCILLKEKTYFFRKSNNKSRIGNLIELNNTSSSSCSSNIDKRISLLGHHLFVFLISLQLLVEHKMLISLLKMINNIINVMFFPIVFNWEPRKR